MKVKGVYLWTIVLFGLIVAFSACTNDDNKKPSGINSYKVLVYFEGDMDAFNKDVILRAQTKDSNINPIDDSTGKELPINVISDGTGTKNYTFSNKNSFSYPKPLTSFIVGVTASVKVEEKENNRSLKVRVEIYKNNKLDWEASGTATSNQKVDITKSLSVR